MAAVAHDRGDDFWAAVVAAGEARGLSKDSIARARGARLLRSSSEGAPFADAAACAAAAIAALADYVRAHRVDYSTPGACSETERDRIEAAVGAAVRSASAAVAAVHAAAAASGSPAATAHRAGVALILADRLKAAAGVFDRARGARYAAAAAARARGGGGGARAGRAPLRAAAAAADDDPSAPPPPPPAFATQDAVLAAEHAALLAELTGTAADARAVEASARELATLNALFSSHVVAQSEAIETLYDAAVEAAGHVAAGNVQLRKANASNDGARAWVLWALLAAAAAVLVADWLSS